MSSQEEQLFIEKALARVEKAEKLQRIKRVVAKVFTIAFALRFAFLPSGPELKIEATIMIFAGLISVICTTAILGQINKNTKDILQAISTRR